MNATSVAIPASDLGSSPGRFMAGLWQVSHMWSEVKYDNLGYSR